MYIDFKGYLKQNNEYVEFIDDVQSDDPDVDNDFINTLVEDSIYELFNSELYTKSGDDIDDTYDGYDISKMNESELLELVEADPRDMAHPSDADASMVNNLDLQVQLSKINYMFIVCFEYLGLRRTTEICSIINRYLTKLSQDFSGIDPEDKKLDVYKKTLQHTYTAIIKAAKKKDENGRDDISLVRINNRLKIIDSNTSVVLWESFGSKAKQFWKGIVNVATYDVGKFFRSVFSFISHKITSWFKGKNRGKKVDMGKVNTFFDHKNTSSRSIRFGSTRGSGGSGDVSNSNSSINPIDVPETDENLSFCAKTIKQKDISTMNGTDAALNPNNLNIDDFRNANLDTGKHKDSFFRSLVLVAIRFGPKTISDILDAENRRRSS